MPQHATAEVGRLPNEIPAFQTERFVLVPLVPPRLRDLAERVLLDPPLAERMPWMKEKSADGARREAFLIELEAHAGSIKGWGILQRGRGMQVGMVLARQSVSGIDIEVLCPSEFWNQGVSDEVGPPLAEWLEDNVEVSLVFKQ